MAFPSRGFDWCYRINCLRNYLRKLERRPKWQHIRFTYDILSFLWSVQPPRVTPAYTGEKHCACFRRTHSRGSPPRMRGKVGETYDRVSAARITPAHAGKSRICCPWLTPRQDHPRACGEKCEKCKYRDEAAGSPPRMRGKVGGRATTTATARITPAHAGKSPIPLGRVDRERDHPRACGEKKAAIVCLARDTGSPPRMRGKVSAEEKKLLKERITPAHAGKRKQLVQHPPLSRDHPRACGEKHVRVVRAALGRGSPPRMRGKAGRAGALSLRHGITPAHAGKRRADRWGN